MTVESVAGSTTSVTGMMIALWWQRLQSQTVHNGLEFCGWVNLIL